METIDFYDSSQNDSEQIYQGVLFFNKLPSLEDIYEGVDELGLDPYQVRFCYEQLNYGGVVFYGDNPTKNIEENDDHTRFELSGNVTCLTFFEPERKWFRIMRDENGMYIEEAKNDD